MIDGDKLILYILHVHNDNINKLLEEKNATGFIGKSINFVN